MKFNLHVVLMSIAIGLATTLPAIAQPNSKTYQIGSQYFTYQSQMQTYIIPCSLQQVFKVGKDDAGDKNYCDRSVARFDRVIMYKPFKNRTGCTLVYPDNRREDIGRCILFDREGKEVEWASS